MGYANTEESGELLKRVRGGLLIVALPFQSECLTSVPAIDPDSWELTSHYIILDPEMGPRMGGLIAFTPESSKK
jgi:hypothetical protein